MDLVVDSCVVISGLIVEDRLHDPAKKFFEAAAARGDITWAPATVLWDVAMRFVRPEVDQIRATVDDEVKPKLHFMPVTAELFHATQQATHLRFDDNALRVVRSSIRGPDHVFLSCALAKRAPLVTWDGKVRAQAADFGVAVITPEDYVEGRIHGVTAPVPTDQEIFAEIQRRVVGNRST